MQEWLSNFTPAVTAILVAGVTGALTYYFTRRREIELRITEEKIKRYGRLIEKLNAGFLRSRLTAEEKTKAKEDYYLESYIVWLFASDDVLKSLNAFARAFARYDAQRTNATQQEVIDAQRDLVHAMRMDTKGDTDLSPEDFVTTTVHP